MPAFVGHSLLIINVVMGIDQPIGQYPGHNSQLLLMTN